MSVVRLSSFAISVAIIALCGCKAPSDLIDAAAMSENTFSESEKLSNRKIILANFSSYSESEIKDCVAAMETAESFAQSNQDSGLNFSETQNQRLFWMEALRLKTGHDLGLEKILSTSNFHLGQAEMSRDDGAVFQDDIAKGCVVKMANALRDIGVSTGYEN